MWRYQGYAKSSPITIYFLWLKFIGEWKKFFIFNFSTNSQWVFIYQLSLLDPQITNESISTTTLVYSQNFEEVKNWHFLNIQQNTFDFNLGGGGGGDGDEVQKQRLSQNYKYLMKKKSKIFIILLKARKCSDQWVLEKRRRSFFQKSPSVTKLPSFFSI